jgi:hypothetical protein
MTGPVFSLTDKHIALLRHAYVGWDCTESGAPCIDPKRPYGNGDVEDDVIRLLFGDLPEDARDALRDYARQLHEDTEIALQIVLTTGAFKPGKYQKGDAYKHLSWVEVTRRRAIRMKQQGVSRGFPDYLVIVGEGLVFIELKRRTGSKIAPEQVEWIGTLHQLPGVVAKICKGAGEAIELIEGVAI